MNQRKSITINLIGITAIAIMMMLLFGFASFPVIGHAEGEAQQPGAEVPTNPEYFQSLEGTQKGAKITLKWGRLADTSMIKVYGGYVGSSMKCLKIIKNNTTTSVTIKKLNNKKINTRKVFKFKLFTYKNVNGVDTLMVKSPVIYIAGTRHIRYTNIKTLKVTQKSFTLAKGTTAKIKAKTTKENKKKELLPPECGPKYSYFSTNKNVATVGFDGTITGVEPGICTVYVYTVNGKNRKVNVTVQ